MTDNTTTNTTKNLSTSEIMALAIDDLVDYRVDKASFDKSYNGIISAVLFEPTTDRKSSDFGKYKVRYKTEEKIVRINDGLVHSIGEQVRIYIFQNDLKNIYVEPVITRILPKTITYTDGNTTDSITQDLVTTEKEIITNGKTYTLTDIFKINIKNKDTEDEEVISIIFPDERKIDFVNW